MRFWLSIASGLGLIGLVACASDSSRQDVMPETVSPAVTLPEKLAITSDWLAGTLSYIDVGALEQGESTRAALTAGRVDLSSHVPGPLSIELTPDRKTALVASSLGFFSIPGSGLLVNAGNLPSGPGKLLFIDVEQKALRAELDTGSTPMGIAIAPDGKRAYVAHFESGDIAVVDVAQRSVIERVAVGPFAEEVALDDSGSVGIVGYSAAGSVRTFTVGSTLTLSPSVDLQGDSAGVAFFPGTKVAFVVQAPNVLNLLTGNATSGYTVIDVSDGTSPVVLEDVRLEDQPIGYPVVAAAARDSVLVPVTSAGRLLLREYKLAGEKVTLASSIDIAPASLLAAYGIAYDGDHTVLLAWPSQRAIVAVDLASQSARVVPWEQSVAGPTDVVFR